MDLLELSSKFSRYYEINKDLQKSLNLKRNDDDNSTIRYTSEDGEIYVNVISLPHAIEYHTMIVLNTDDIKQATKHDKKLKYIIVTGENNKKYEWTYDQSQTIFEYCLALNIKSRPKIRVLTKHFKEID